MSYQLQKVRENSNLLPKHICTFVLKFMWIFNLTLEYVPMCAIRWVWELIIGLNWEKTQTWGVFLVFHLLPYASKRVFVNLWKICIELENHKYVDPIEARFQTIVTTHYSLIIQQLLIPCPIKQLVRFLIPYQEKQPVAHNPVCVEIYSLNLSVSIFSILLCTWLHWKYSYTWRRYDFQGTGDFGVHQIWEKVWQWGYCL